MKLKWQGLFKEVNKDNLKLNALLNILPNRIKYHSALNNIKENKYLLISAVIHVGVAIYFLYPFLFINNKTDFISLNNQIPIQIIIQEPQNTIKDTPKKKEGVLKNKPNPKEKTTKNSPVEQQETIVSSQNVENIKYSILKSTEPAYPNAIKRLNLQQKVVIKTRLLVNKAGEITKIEFLQSNVDESLEKHFQKEVQKALNSWKFSTITVNNIPVNIYFYKDFVFING
ncbi:MAG: hypothetical protein LBH40_05025 [Alphaproteobacteria bacterium]|jgi:hypothetical protein|nr:hypothetical protein [Alphaproteobacteria bacterium]